MLAAQLGDVEKFEQARLKLPTETPITSITDDSKRTLLYLASQGGHTRLISHLLESCGFDPNAGGAHDPPLVAACSSGHSSACSTLIEAGADPNAVSANGMSALFLASAKAAIKLRAADNPADAQDSISCVEILLQSGASPNTAAAGGFTPLHVAAESGSECLVKALLSAGADANARTDVGQTAAALAFSWGHREIAETILKAEGGEQLTSLEELVAKEAASAAARRNDPELGNSSSTASSQKQKVPSPEDPDIGKAEALQAEGNQAFAAGDFLTALARYRAALRHRTDSAVLWSNAAAAALRVSMNEDALRDARIARALDDTCLKAWYREGQAGEALGLWEDAAAAYFEAHLRRPEGMGGVDFGELVKRAVEQGRREHALAKSASSEKKEVTPS